MHVQVQALRKSKPRIQIKLSELQRKLKALKRAHDTAEAPDPSKPEPDLLGACFSCIGVDRVGSSSASLFSVICDGHAP